MAPPPRKIATREKMMQIIQDLASKKQLKKAVKWASRAIILFPGDIELYELLGNLAWTDGQYDIAALAFRAILQTKPFDAEARINLAICLSATGFHHDSLNELIFVIRHNPSNAQAFMNMASTYFILDMLEQAISSILESIRLRPDVPQGYSILGGIYFKQLRYGSAEEAFKAAVMIQPDDPMAHFRLGAAFMMQNREKSAIREFEIACYLGDKDSCDITQ